MPRFAADRDSPGASASVIAGWRDASTLHMMLPDVGAAIFDETEPHVEFQQRSQSTFLKCRASMRSRSFSRSNGDLCCLIRRRQSRQHPGCAALPSAHAQPRGAPPTGAAQNAKPSSLATDPIERPLEAIDRPAAAYSHP